MEISGQYLEYSDYQSLGGTLAEMPFKILEFNARQNVDKYTFGRLKNLSTQVEDTKLCIYALINLLESYEDLENNSKAVSNESIDGYSVTYAENNSNTLTAKNEAIKSIIRTYLVDCKLDDGTPYLYRGV